MGRLRKVSSQSSEAAAVRPVFSLNDGHVRQLRDESEHMASECPTATNASVASCETSVATS